MKFLCLGYYDVERFDRMETDEQLELARECRPHDERLYGTGKVQSVASLEHRKAVTLKPENGTTRVIDGPFAEAKEALGSFFIIEAESLEEAVEIASLHPAARWGEHLGFAVEVRPIDYYRLVAGS